MSPPQQMASDRVATGLAVIAGVVLLAAPFVLGFSGVSSPTTVDVGFGIAIAIVALLTFAAPAYRTWLDWLNVILGVLVVISPWVGNWTSNSTQLWTDIVMGVIVVLLAGWSALGFGADRR